MSTGPFRRRYWSPRHKMHEGCDNLALRTFGPISRHRIAQVLPAIRSASRATRPGLAVWIIRVMCNRLCTSKRFHVDDDDQGCRQGCRRHYNQSPRMAAIPISEGRCSLASELLLHDLTRKTGCLGIQHRILVLGVIDAFVCTQPSSS